GEGVGLIQVRVSGAAEGADGGLAWDVSEHSPEGDLANRGQLLQQLGAVADLRRRLRYCQYADVFTELEWSISQYELSSQSEHFWKLPEASKLAQEAELARKVVDPVVHLEGELTALEDFATEAYHSHAFDIVGD